MHFQIGLNIDRTLVFALLSFLFLLSFLLLGGYVLLTFEGTGDNFLLLFPCVYVLVYD